MKTPGNLISHRITPPESVNLASDEINKNDKKSGIFATRIKRVRGCPGRGCGQRYVVQGDVLGRFGTFGEGLRGVGFRTGVGL